MMPRMRLYQTPLGIVCANTAKDCRAILAVAGANPAAKIEPVRRARGVVFEVAAYIEPDTIDTHVEKFKWMGSDERRRELVKLQNLPPDYGPLFGESTKASDDNARTDAAGDARLPDQDDAGK